MRKPVVGQRIQRGHIVDPRVSRLRSGHQAWSRTRPKSKSSSRLLKEPLEEYRYSQARHGRACPGHRRGPLRQWMPGTRPGAAQFRSTETALV